MRERPAQILPRQHFMQPPVNDLFDRGGKRDRVKQAAAWPVPSWYWSQSISSSPCRLGSGSSPPVRAECAGHFALLFRPVVHAQTGNPIELTAIVGHHRQAMRQRDRGNKQIVPAGELAGCRQTCSFLCHRAKEIRRRRRRRSRFCPRSVRVTRRRIHMLRLPSEPKCSGALRSSWFSTASFAQPPSG